MDASPSVEGDASTLPAGGTARSPRARIGTELARCRDACCRLRRTCANSVPRLSVAQSLPPRPATFVVKSDDKEADDDLRRWSSSWRLAARLGVPCRCCVGYDRAGGRSCRRRDGSKRRTPRSRALRDVLHTPPLLVEQGRPVELRYDVVCQADVREAVRAGRQRVPSPRSRGRAIDRSHSRPAGGTGARGGGGRSPPRALLLRRDRRRRRELADGAGGGAVAPQRAWAVPSLTQVSLGTHTFGRVREARRSCRRRHLGNGRRCSRAAHWARACPHGAIGV